MREVSGLDDLIPGDKPIVVEFTNSVTCAPCRMLKPHWERVASDMADVVDFAVVDIMGQHDVMEVLDAFGVRATPQIYMIKPTGEKIVIHSRTAIPLAAEIQGHLD